MHTKKLIGLAFGLTAVVSLAACGNSGGDGGATDGNMTIGLTDIGDGDGDGDVGDGDGDGDGSGCPVGGCLDLPPSTDGGGGGCAEGGTCSSIDLLFVIDNSGTMAAEQANLAANFTNLIDQLAALEDTEGNPVVADVHIMVTTTDMDHSLCTDFHPGDYEPAKGTPVTTPCTDRLADFQITGENATTACTSVCESAVTLNDVDFIEWSGDSTNVNAGGATGADAAKAALECIGPQGITGCGYESPLEAMVQALSPSAPWNQGNRPFLRDDAVLAVAIITDEADCSTAPAGQVYFYDDANNTYWPDDPDNGNMKTRATSATCWYSGVECTGYDANTGEYADCTSADNGVLHSTEERYIKFLKEQLNKDTVMLGILGIPEVTMRNDVFPFEPLAGGINDLVYRDWQAGDIVLPGDTDTVADKTFDFGIGPGCTNVATGQAIPPVRVREVCESLEEGTDQVRCCMESICDDDFSPAIKCLTGVLQSVITPG